MNTPESAIPGTPIANVQLQPGEAERAAIIDLSAVEHNVRTLKHRIGERQLIAVVKADAYGHGAYPVARSVLEAGADMLAVVHVSEALELRSEGIEAPIIAWLHTPRTDFEEAIEADVRLGVSGWDLEAIAIAAAKLRMRAIVHLKADTGLGRNGSTDTEWPALISRSAELEAAGLIRVEGIFTHFAVADEPERAETAQQTEKFNKFVAAARAAGLTPDLIHLANSPATLTGASEEYNTPEAVLGNAVRCGLAIYGLSPLAGVSAQQLGLRPVMTLTGYVSAVKEVPAGQGVSYGLRYTTDKPTTLALIPLGYADGVPRIAANAPVRIYPRDAEAKTYRVVGRIAMDQLVVDLGEPGLSNPELGYLGARAVLFGAGPNPPVEEWAEASETINYEVVTRISSRVIRIYSGGTWIEREIDVLHSLDEALKDIDTSVPEGAQ